MKLANIRLGKRFRKDMGNVETLAASIESVGLLHPVVVTSKGQLIAGQRRLEAFRLLGRKEIPATIIDLDNILLGQREENVQRKDFLPSEAVAIGKALEPLEKAEAKKRQEAGTPSTKLVEGSRRERESTTRVARAVGMGAETYKKAVAVVESGGPKLIADMDKSGTVDRAYRKLIQKRRTEERGKALRKAEALPAKAERYRLIRGDFVAARIEDASLDWVVTDPPYSKEFLPLYPKLAKFAAEKLNDGGSLLCMVGQSYLPEIYTALSEMLIYRWTLAYMTPGAACAIWHTQIGSHWKPVLWYSKGEPLERLGLTDDVCTSTKQDKAHHDWGQSESGMESLMGRFLSPGEKVCDPFCGAGTTGVIALRLGCQFIGIDTSEEAIGLSKKRLHDEAAQG